MELVRGSRHGAVEMACGPRLVSGRSRSFPGKSFGRDCSADEPRQLSGWIAVVRTRGYGDVARPDTGRLHERNVVFTWNATTSGVRVPAARLYIPISGKRLRPCDATRRHSPSTLPWTARCNFLFLAESSRGRGRPRLIILLRRPGPAGILEPPTWPLRISSD